MHFYKNIAHFIFSNFTFQRIHHILCAQKTEDIDSSVFYKTIYLYLKLLITFTTPGRDLYSSALPEESITIIFLFLSDN